jgi:hypothetical protein
MGVMVKGKCRRVQWVHLHVRITLDAGLREKRKTPVLCCVGSSTVAGTCQCTCHKGRIAAADPLTLDFPFFWYIL